PSPLPPRPRPHPLLTPLLLLPCSLLSSSPKTNTAPALAGAVDRFLLDTHHCRPPPPRPPPHPPRPPPPPPPPAGLGRASFTLSCRPPSSAPFRAAIAACACDASSISTNPNPRGRPVSRSMTSVADDTAPCFSNVSRSSASVVLNDRFPT